MGKWQVEYEGDEPRFGSGAFFELRSDEELREIVSEHIPSQPLYQGAKDELARRAGIEQERLTRRTYWAAVAALVVTIIGVIVTVLTA